EQRSDALFAQDRIEDVRMVDVSHEDRHPLGGDSSSKALSEGDPDPTLDLLLDPLRGPRHQLLGVAVEEQDRRRVDAERLPHAGQELVEQGLEAKLRKSGIAEAIEVADLL